MSENRTAPTPIVTTAELLEAAESGSGKGKSIARGAGFSDGAYAVLLGVMVASFLLAIKYIFPTGDLWLVFGSVAIYGLGVVGLVLWNQRRRRASRPGWSKRYAVGLTLTMSLYAVGVALSVADEPSSLAFWIPYAVLTAVPLTVAAFWSGRE